VIYNQLGSHQEGCNHVLLCFSGSRPKKKDRTFMYAQMPFVNTQQQHRDTAGDDDDGMMMTTARGRRTAEEDVRMEHRVTPGTRRGTHSKTPHDEPPPKETLYNFLLGCKVEKGCEHTHTSFQRPVGAFYIPSTQNDKFMALYRQAFLKGEDLYLTEKHRHLSPLLIDLDFRYNATSAPRHMVEIGGGDEPGTSHEHRERDVIDVGVDVGLTSSEPAPNILCRTPMRKYSVAHIHSIVYVYGSQLKRLALLPEYVDFYVMEKSKASWYKQAPQNGSAGVAKDGLHIVAPSLVLRSSAQYILRRSVLHQLSEVMSDIDLVNTIEDVVDEAVVERNNWMMYGSKKPMGEPYQVTHIIRFIRDTEEIVEKDIRTLDKASLVETLSIRNKYDEISIRGDAMPEISVEQEKMDERQRRRDAQQLVVGTTQNTRTNVCESMDTVSKLIDILSPERAEVYNSWIRVGWCLRNIDHRLMAKWVEFSRKSRKYNDGECEKLWNYMRPGGLGIGTLHMWAKQDNLDEYRQILRKDLVDLIVRCTSGTHNDVARVVYHMYKYDYVCASIRNKCWYEFRDHRWRQSDCAYTLRKKISNEVVREFTSLSNHYIQISHQPSATASASSSLSSEAIESSSNTMIDIAHKLNGIAIKLKTTNFKDNVMKECCEMFYHEKFEEKLDSHCHLIGFENGVYDLEALEFREGRPDDFISFTTGVNYTPFDPDSPHVHQVNEFLSKVLPNTAVRDYVMRILAGALNGHIREERFHVWTGSGSNGKSKTIELFEKSFGDYCCKFPVTLLTQKRAASNAATSEIARAKGKRFAVLQEPSEDEKLNIGLMKELTGGDKIMTRKLYSEPQEWKPQWTLALLCNHLPNVPSDDGGTWRRIRVVEFNSRFVENPNPEKPNEFAMDQELSKKFDNWREPFISMLLDVYKGNVNKRLLEPEEVTACTREYQKNNDHMADFTDTCLQRSTDPVAAVTLNDIFQELRDWIRDDNIPIRVPKKKDVQNYLDKNIGKACHMGGGRIVYKGYVLRDRMAGPPLVSSASSEQLSDEDMLDVDRL
jgi:P4 family phage/plasmid primase-like protien